MHAAKIAITVDAELLHQLDSYVDSHLFKNRSQAIQFAVQDLVNRLARKRLAEECAKLNVSEEQSLAEEQLPLDETEWSKY